MLGLFLQAEGRPLPEYSQVKSPSALSRFLNEYRWSTRQVIRTLRHQVCQRLLDHTAFMTKTLATSNHRPHNTLSNAASSKSLSI